MQEHETSVAEFHAAIGPSPEEPVAHLATIGADWYLYHDKTMHGYIAAQTGHAGGDSFSTARRRPLRWWSFEAASQLQAWEQAVAYITGRVHEDLVNEWTDFGDERYKRGHAAAIREIAEGTSADAPGAGVIVCHVCGEPPDADEVMALHEGYYFHPDHCPRPGADATAARAFGKN